MPKKHIKLYELPHINSNSFVPSSNHKEEV